MDHSLLGQGVLTSPSVWHNAVMNLVRLDGQNLRRATSIVDLFDQQPSIGIDGGDRIDSFENGSIEFKNVSFMRPDWPLHQKDISFKVESGSTIIQNGAKLQMFMFKFVLYARIQIIIGDHVTVRRTSVFRFFRASKHVKF